jgi:farnesyl-diphosphate farnesyltransferase
MDDPSRAVAILALWEHADWPALTDLERRMMGREDGLMLWQLYGAMPAAARVTVHRWIGAMAQGMSHLSDPTRCPCFVRRGAVEVLEAESDYDMYCYYVAGTVGNLASELVVMQYRLAADVAATLQARAAACGRSLQKTNILKDFVEDLARGICYLPDAWLQTAGYTPLELRGAEPAWKAMVLANVLDELRDATDYLLALPLNAPGYRRASLLCLLPAYQTLLLAAERQATLFTSEHQIKIPHPTMAQCITDSERMLHDNDAIRQYSRRLETEIRGHFARSGGLSER